MEVSPQIINNTQTLLTGSTERYYIGGGQGKRKDNKTRKSKSEEKVVGFSSAFLFPARKREVIAQGGNYGDRPPEAEDNSGSMYLQRLRGQA